MTGGTSTETEGTIRSKYRFQYSLTKESGTTEVAHPGNVIERERRLGLECVHVEVLLLTESQVQSSEVDALRSSSSTQGERESCWEPLTLNPSQRSTVTHLVIVLD